jgi:type III pantothenate kinase
VNGVSRLLLIDVGNTSTTLALGSRGRVTHVTRVGHLCTQREELLSAVQSLVRGTQVERAVIGSVVPDETAQWRMALPEMGLAGLYVDHRTPMPVGVDYPRPATIGADRLANSSAAWVRYGTASIVADFGTALTFDIISAEGNYVGGVIAPGLAMMTEYLSERTALLPRLGLHGVCPDVGRSTEGAMRIGARVGYRGIVREVTHYLMARNGLESAHLCATGGMAGWALSGLDMNFTLEPDLTLFGLAQIGFLNMERIEQWT